jgi:hypothetical protein
MKMGKMTFATVASALFALGIGSSSYASGVSSSAIDVEHYKGIPYVSGGFGIEERHAMATVGRKDNLELSFALQNKEYLGGAEVLIKDDRGNKVLETASDGPLFFAKLPEGKYTVMATALGRTLTRVVDVPDKGQARLYFTWKEPGSKAAPTLAKK